MLAHHPINNINLSHLTFGIHLVKRIFFFWISETLLCTVEFYRYNCYLSISDMETSENIAIAVPGIQFIHSS